MIKVAVVEDEKVFSEQLSEYLHRYGADKGQRFRITVYDHAAAFLDAYQGGFDLVFMDIQMPGINGMDAARLLRERDEKVQIVFVTSLEAYAINGYEVGAVDFIVKPFEYRAFALRLSRVLLRLQKQKRFIFFTGKGTQVRLNTDDIRYIESEGHRAVYHLADSTITRRETLSVCEGELPSNFARCNSWLIVNLDFVQDFDGEDITVEVEKLRVSKPKRAAFRRKLAEYRGE